VGNKFKLESTDVRKFGGGTLAVANKQNFRILEKLSIQSIRLQPGAQREPHVHPNAAQIDYCVSGEARVGIVGAGGEHQLLDLDAGDVSYVPQGHLHWIENRGSSPLHMILITSHEAPETIELSQMFAGVPNQSLAALFGVDEGVFGQFPNEAVTISGNKR
jgi:oxalate decarboxylase/phosphoglucose isomerase-like protein (cupin superfamily)